MKRIYLLGTLCVSICLIAGCTAQEYRDKCIYVNECTGISIHCPEGYVFKEREDQYVYYTIFSKRNSAILPVCNLGITFAKHATSRQRGMPSEATIEGLLKRYKENSDDASKAVTILSEGESTFQDLPAYILEREASESDNLQTAYMKVIATVRNQHTYVIVYVIPKDDNYHDNVATMEDALNTLVFSLPK